MRTLRPYGELNLSVLLVRPVDGRHPYRAARFAGKGMLPSVSVPSEIAAKPAETEVAEPTENVRCWHLATTWTPSRAAAAVYSTGKLR